MRRIAACRPYPDLISGPRVIARLQFMYIRFVCAQRSTRARAEVGLFRSAYRDIDWGSASDCWIRDEIDRSLQWFDTYLDAPNVVTRCGRDGICWFRDSAARHVSEARYLARLLTEAGHPIAELRMDRPGTVIWSDAHQVVALPERDHPCLFRVVKARH